MTAHQLPFHPLADIFPLLDGALNVSQRALVAARMVEEGRKNADIQSAWVKKARAQFQPGPKRPCEVCGGSSYLSQAHHVLPLYHQARKRMRLPNHEHVWLCPTHHAAIHVLLNCLVLTKQPPSFGFSETETQALDRIGVRFVELLFCAPAHTAVEAMA